MRPINPFLICLSFHYNPVSCDSDKSFGSNELVESVEPDFISMYFTTVEFQMSKKNQTSQLSQMSQLSQSSQKSQMSPGESAESS